jgi:hypothetical protein
MRCCTTCGEIVRSPEHFIEQPEVVSQNWPYKQLVLCEKCSKISVDVVLHVIDLLITRRLVYFENHFLGRGET